MKRVIVAILATLAVLAPTTAIASAAPSPAYFSYTDWAGYVTLNSASKNSSEMTIDVTIEATRGAVPVNPLYFFVKAADGTTYDYSWTGDSTLRAGDLPAGQKTRGTVVFDITGGPEPTQVIYEAPLGEQLTSWTITWKPAPKPAPKRAAPFGSSAS
ncbi:DUF1942 domain-containing protein [Gordonia sp. ABKF26]|jgi:hypothetical protein|uniref:DUF1942 domain-containing protein n=1 Tax=Gordonia sp. ABKF26 TaxID=3238687 RepID=UPI0034E48A05